MELGAWSMFFFSSRRRHTRWTGDWSSDVCSSDLGGTGPGRGRYLRSYPERSEFTDLTVSERHGLIVTASGEPQRLQQRDDPLWQQAIRDGAARSEERRVGKGRRCRWWPEPYKEQR